MPTPTNEKIVAVWGPTPTKEKMVVLWGGNVMMDRDFIKTKDGLIALMMFGRMAARDLVSTIRRTRSRF